MHRASVPKWFGSFNYTQELILKCEYNMISFIYMPCSDIQLERFYVALKTAVSSICPLSHFSQESLYLCVCVLIFVYLSVYSMSLPLYCIDWDLAVLSAYVYHSVDGGLKLANFSPLTSLMTICLRSFMSCMSLRLPPDKL